MTDMQVLMASSHRQVSRGDGKAVTSSGGKKVASTKSDRRNVSTASGSRQLPSRAASHSTVAADDIGHLVTLIVSTTIQTTFLCKTTQAHTCTHTTVIIVILYVILLLNFSA